MNAEVEAVIFDMIADQEFKDFITSKHDERVDVKTLEEERCCTSSVASGASCKK